MFSRKHRIKTSDINQIFKDKIKTINSEVFLFKIKENEVENNRFAVIVPKKIYKTAVKRHLYKRKVVSILKKINERMEKDNLDIVVTLRKNISDLDDSEIENQLAEILI